MTKFFDTMKGIELVNTLRTFFEDKKISYHPGKPFIFVCGGDKNRDDTFRHKFLKYSEEHLVDYGVFLAEDAFDEITDNGKFIFVNVAKFEELIAELSDCIVIFPETPGSFAEVGYFSTRPKIRKNVLIINPVREQGSSFLNIGPLELIDKYSNFKSTIYLDDKLDPLDFSSVKNRLSNRIKTRSTFKTFSNVSFKKIELKERIFLTLSLIGLVNPINFENLQSLMINLFGNYEYSNNLRQYLAILIHGDLLEKKEVEHHDFFWITKKGEALIKYKFDRTKLRLSIMKHYGQLDYFELSEAIK